MKLRTKSIMLLICFIFFIVAPVLADTTDTTDDDSGGQTTETRSTTPTAKDNSLAQALSNGYKTTVTGQDVANLRVNNSLGYGEIGMVYGLANVAGKTTADILAMRQGDMGWGAIAKSLGLKVSTLMNKNSSVLKAAKMDKENKTFKNEVKKEENQGSSTDNGKDKSGSNQNGKGSGSGNGNSGGNGGGNGGGGGSKGK